MRRHGYARGMADDLEIRNKPPCSRDDATAVLRRLREAGHVAYFAGGCVRDLLLGLTPKDYDVATDASPKRVRQLFSNTQAVGAAFGVILVRHGRSVVEVATFRSEGEYHDGRRPSQVHFTTAEEDAQRRDFTINGLFLDPLENDRVIDYVGGVEDLKARRLRAIGDPNQRFAEDHLRLMRAVRFAARFGLAIEPATAAAILKDAPSLKRISPERIGDELRLMLTPATRNVAWRWLWQFRLVEVIFRFVPIATDLALNEERSIFLATAPGQTIPFGLALATGTLCVRWQGMKAEEDLRPLLARAEAQRMVRAMRQALKISNDESDQMQGAIEGLGPLLGDAPPTVARMKRFLAGATANESRRLMEAIQRVGLHQDRIDWLRQQLSELDKGEVAPLPLITGDDLTAAGLTPGPVFKGILESVYDAQLEGRVGTREEAMAMAMAMKLHDAHHS